MIEMKKVVKKYTTGNVALKNVSVKIEQGEFVYVVGASGAGKSTFIKLLYREENVSNGAIFLDDINICKLPARKVPYLRRQMGVVFQDFKLLPMKNVYENIAYALEVIEVDAASIKKRVHTVLKRVGLLEKAKQFPHELSGGEQQRVSIARALVNKPRIIIADEPTGNLDPETTMNIMRLFEKIHAEGTTVIMATHNREVVDRLPHRVIRFADGKIVQDMLRGGYDD